MKRQINVRLSDEARAVLGKLADQAGVSEAAVLELWLRKEGRKLQSKGAKAR